MTKKKSKLLNGDPESPMAQTVTMKIRFEDRVCIGTSEDLEKVYQAFETLRDAKVIDDYHMYDFE